MGTDRKAIERRHGARLAASAEETWGWSTPAGRLRVSRRMREITRFLDKANGCLLEFGCGTGVFTQELLKCGYRVVAFDISFDLARKIRQKQSAARVLIADAEALPFADGTFDAVFGVSVLHHLDLDASLKQISRVLKKGGVLAFSEPNMANPQIFLQKNIAWVKKCMGDTPTETAFFRWGLKRRLLEAGFSEISVRPFEFLHPRTPSFLINGLKQAEPFLESCPLISEIAGSLLISARKK